MIFTLRWSFGFSLLLRRALPAHRSEELLQPFRSGIAEQLVGRSLFLDSRL
ncbi:hypothetical protein U879_13715 [Defluviimonas sp. 20V17]|nr:hypothetical protein U879_13715 [Defluviimonas sp. 20V17]